MAVNYACRFLMPVHPIIDEVGKNIFETEKYWITAAEENILL